MDDVSSSPWWRKDATVFAALIAIAAVAFTSTYFISKAYGRKQESLSRHWMQSGESDLKAGRTAQAVGDLRTSLLYSNDDAQHRLRLAQALAADNQTNQAIAYFLNLWEEHPGSGLYNLELARAYARTGDLRKATQFYNGAIYGAWEQDPVEQRRGARVEFIQFLLDHNSTTQAQAEAINLTAAVTPSDIPARFTAADVLLKTGEFEHAIEQYSGLIQADPARASSGAARAAFQLGRFRSVLRYADEAVSRGVDDAATKSMWAQARLVLDADPNQRRISASDRAERVMQAFKQSGERLAACGVPVATPSPPTAVSGSASPDLQSLYDQWTTMGSTLQLAKLSADPDLRDQVMDLVFRIEQTSSRHCSMPVGADWALLMLSRFGEGVQR